MTFYALLNYDASVKRVVQSEFNLSNIDFLYQSTVKELCSLTIEKLCQSLNGIQTNKVCYRTEETINDFSYLFNFHA